MWLSWLKTCLQCGRPGFDPWVGKISWRMEKLPIQYSGLENSMNCSVHGIAKESDITDKLSLSLFTIWTCIAALRNRSPIKWYYEWTIMCMRAKSLQSCPILCYPMNCSPPGSSVYGILQSRILQWVSMPLQWDFPDSGIEPCLLCLLHWQVGSLPLVRPGEPTGPLYILPIKQLHNYW